MRNTVVNTTPPNHAIPSTCSAPRMINPQVDSRRNVLDGVARIHWQIASGDIVPGVEIGDKSRNDHNRDQSAIERMAAPQAPLRCTLK